MRQTWNVMNFHQCGTEATASSIYGLGGGKRNMHTIRAIIMQTDTVQFIHKSNEYNDNFHLFFFFLVYKRKCIDDYYSQHHTHSRGTHEPEPMRKTTFTSRSFDFWFLVHNFDVPETETNLDFWFLDQLLKCSFVNERQPNWKRTTQPMSGSTATTIVKSDRLFDGNQSSATKRNICNINIMNSSVIVSACVSYCSSVI